MASPTPFSDTTQTPCLVPISLDNPESYDLLLAQRKVCGWAWQALPHWRDCALRGEKQMFWICLPSSHPRLASIEASPTVVKLSDDPTKVIIGHISLDRKDPNDEPEPSMTAEDGSVLGISALFVHPSCRRLHLGDWAMSTIERYAQELPYGSLNCRAVTINSLSRQYYVDEGPEGRGRWAMLGLEAPPSDSSNEDWYTKRGYVKYMEKYKFKDTTVDGEEYLWKGVYLRKELGKPKAAASESKPTQEPSLVPISLDHPQSYDLLYTQRQACGWGWPALPHWQDCARRGERQMFWICIPSSHPHLASIEIITPVAKLPGDPEKVLVGHISLDRKDMDDQPEPSMTSDDGSVLVISSLFVVASCRRLRLGDWAMSALEAYAQELPYGSPKCRAVVLNTISSQYYVDEGPEGRGRWALVGRETPSRHSSSADWYTRRGYVQYMEKYKFKDTTIDGKESLWNSVYLRKELGQPKAASC